MYASLAESPAVTAARRLARQQDQQHSQQHQDEAGAASLPILEQQLCAEAGLWAPREARRALEQGRGDLPQAVALLRVWAAALPQVPSLPTTPPDVVLTRRISAAYADVPGGQWLGASPDTASRLLVWNDEHTREERHSHRDEGPTEPPRRSTCPRVRELLASVAVKPMPDNGDGTDPARSALVPPYDRATRLGLLARGETASLIALGSLALSRRREAVLLELTVGAITLRLPHPRTGSPCRVAEVPFVEAEAVVDAEVAQRPGLAIGWGASLGGLERRAIAIALLDGVLQADGDRPADASLDEATVFAAVDGPATNGFVEHLRLPHYASFASYLDRARHHQPPGDDPLGEEP